MPSVSSSLKLFWAAAVNSAAKESAAQQRNRAVLSMLLFGLSGLGRIFTSGFSVSLIRPDWLHFVLDRTAPIGSWCRVFHECVQHTPSGFCPWWRRRQFFAQPNPATVR